MATYEGKWRCLRCSVVNLGRNLNCRACGVKRGEDVELFLEDNAPAITDAELLKQAQAGADWICRYCGGNNRAFQAQCSSCGNNRSDEDWQLVEETRGINDWSENAQRAARQFTGTAETQNISSLPGAFFSSRIFKFLLLGAGGLTVLIVALPAILMYLSSLTYATEIEVIGLEWTRSIALEEYKTVSESAWEGEVPQGARVQSQTRALHHTDRVPEGTRSVPETYSEQISDGTERYVCGRTSKKNGYFEDKYCTRTKYKTVTKTRSRTETIYRDVPIYKTRYSYLIDKWVSAGEKTLSGTDFNPQWASVLVDQTHREGKHTETYNLRCKEFGGDNKPHKVKLTPENWPQFKMGEHLHGKTNFFGKLVSIEELPNGEW